jgi:Uma2 family endonuclease
MSAVIRAVHRFSVDDYHRMAETGILAPADRTELIDGEIIHMPAVGSPHIGAVLALTRLLVRAVPSSVVVSVQSPIQMGDQGMPEPDLALLRSRPDGYRTPPSPAAEDVLLLIEVSDTSLRFDRDTKVPLDARHGVPEVWIVDLAAGVVEVYRKPAGATYTEVATRGRGEALEPLLQPGLSIPVEDIVA